MEMVGVWPSSETLATASEDGVVVQQTTIAAPSSWISLRTRLTDLVGSDASSYWMNSSLKGSLRTAICSR